MYHLNLSFLERKGSEASKEVKSSAKGINYWKNKTRRYWIAGLKSPVYDVIVYKGHCWFMQIRKNEKMLKWVVLFQTAC